MTQLSEQARTRALERFQLLRLHLEDGVSLARVARERGIALIGANLGTPSFLVWGMCAEEAAGEGGLVGSSSWGVAAEALEGGEALLEGEEVDRTANGLEDGVVPEHLPAPATEGAVGVVEPGVEGSGGRGGDLAGEEGGEDDGQEVGLGGVGGTGAEPVEVPDALEALEEQLNQPSILHS